MVGLRKLAVILILAGAATHATSPSNNFTIAKPGSVDRCGNVSIPFPFGTAERCTRTAGGDTVPFLGNSGIDIKSISLTSGQLTVMQFTAHQCYARNETTVAYADPWINFSKFTVSSAANKFIVVGCDTTGSVFGRRLDDRSYNTGCTATCQTSIPKNVRRVNISLGSSNNYREGWNFSNCGYAFVVEETAFTFSPEMITTLMNVVKLPMVVDWAIGKGICEEAMANSSANYACKSVNSECYEPYNGLGYRCNCTQGYQGNPYLADGCRDTDKCNDTELNNCIKAEYCLNKIGSFDCICPKGYHGDGRRHGQGCLPISDS